MAEQLIYGKDVQYFGAVGDGVTDDTEAFRAAFASGESRITIPYGSGAYLIKEPLQLPSGITLDAHERAVIRFAGIQAAPNARNIRIIGGCWEMTETDGAAIIFNETDRITLENMQFSGSAQSLLHFNSCSDISIENLRFHADSNTAALRFSGTTSFATLRGLTVEKAAAAIEFMPSAEISGLIGLDLYAHDCARILTGDSASLTDCRLCTIHGEATEQAIDFCDCKLDNVTIKHCRVCDSYIHLANNSFSHFYVMDFMRESDREINPSKPTLTFSGTDAVLLCDGISLDAIILAKKSVPTTKITAARMASPVLGKHIYTADLTLNEGNRFIIPVGSFEMLEVSGLPR